MTEYAEIRVSQSEFLGRLMERRYEWIGPLAAPVRVQYHQCLDLSELPWRLTKLYDDFLWGGAVCVRQDGPRALTGRITKARYVCRTAATSVRCRVIMTAMLWGLAHVPPNEIPSWCHLWKKPPPPFCW